MPSTPSSRIDNIKVPDRFFCKEVVSLHRSVFERIQACVRSLWLLRQHLPYISWVKQSHPFLKEAPPTHLQDCLFLALDFYITHTGPRLIEINTNAALALLSCRQTPSWDYTTKLRQNLIPYFEESGFRKVFLIDENIAKQKLSVEFALYQELFRQWGVACEICETVDLLQKTPAHRDEIGWVYNRCTDFFFESSQHLHLHEAYLDGSVRFAPNPMDYALMAYKQRLVDFCQKSFWQEMALEDKQTAGLRSCLIPTKPVSHWNSPKLQEELWNQKEHYVFKPKNQHGGKNVHLGRFLQYDGFKSIKDNPNYIVQEYVEPAKHKRWNWDLRAFVHQGEVQMLVARIWQGQVTNRNTPGDGLAQVCVID